MAAVDESHDVSAAEQEKLILQFGKIGKDTFTMDYMYPLSAFQAFAICLSGFDTKPVSQLVGTVIAAAATFGTSWWLLVTIPSICDPANLPEGSPWTCPGDRVFYSESVIWGLVSPNRMFGSRGLYENMNYFFLLVVLAPVTVWILSRFYLDWIVCKITR